MSLVDEAKSFEDLEYEFSAKITDLKLIIVTSKIRELQSEVQVHEANIAGHLRSGWENDTVIRVEECSQQLHRILEKVECQKSELKFAHQQITELKHLFSYIDMLSKRLLHIKENLPQHFSSLQETSLNLVSSSLTNTCVPKQIKNENIDSQRKAEPAKNTEKVVCKPSKPIPRVQFITLPEYETVPKYTKGRISYDKVNSVIKEINNAICRKYTLLRKPRSKLSPSEMDMVENFKHQINEESKGFCFVVDNDLKAFSDLKLDTTVRKIFTILRTMRRLKEVRGPGNLLRYCIPRS